jgi:hypothetical protein
MLAVMRDESSEPRVRLEAAKAAAPYVHSKLAAVQPKDDTSDPLKDFFANICFKVIRPREDAGRPAGDQTDLRVVATTSDSDSVPPASPTPSA